MEKLTMFMMGTCPYCKAALNWMVELKNENTAYDKIEVEMIDETQQAELAAKYDYYYVPTYYYKGVKLHEGAATKDKIKAVFDAVII